MTKPRERYMVTVECNSRTYGVLETIRFPFIGANAFREALNFTHDARSIPGVVRSWYDQIHTAEFTDREAAMETLKMWVR